VRPLSSSQNLLFLVYNLQDLNTHITDLDILLNIYRPHICILSGVGSASKNLPSFPGYQGIAQIGSNSFGGVAMFFSNVIKYEVVEKEINFLVTEIIIAGEQIKVGAVYVPPTSALPLHLFEKYKQKAFILFGDYNAKHTFWNCQKNNKSGNELFNWIEQSGIEMVYPHKATSRKSDAILDFGITHNKRGMS
jgi:hypothetical protein